MQILYGLILVYIVFMFISYYAGNIELTVNRYAAFGIVALITALWGVSVYSKRRFAVKTVITSILSAVILLSHVIAVLEEAVNYTHFN